MGDEDMPVSEYEPLARQFRPLPNAARAWARLAREAGMRYMVMTTKHHEGFCLFDSKLTEYCAPRQGPAAIWSVNTWMPPEPKACASDSTIR